MANCSIQYNPPPEKQGYTINILVDDPHSWIIPWARKLKQILFRYHDVHLVHNQQELRDLRDLTMMKSHGV